jgi:hypothetical protein
MLQNSPSVYMLFPLSTLDLFFNRNTLPLLIQSQKFDFLEFFFPLTFYTLYKRGKNSFQ